MLAFQVNGAVKKTEQTFDNRKTQAGASVFPVNLNGSLFKTCLLYTSDAADELT